MQILCIVRRMNESPAPIAPLPETHGSQAPTRPDHAVDAARAIAHLAEPQAIERDRTGEYPVAELEALSRSGLLGLTIPSALNGAGAGPSVLADVIRTLAATDPSLAQIPQGHYLYVDVLRLAAAPAVAGRIFGDVLAGGRIGNAAAERGGRHAQDLSTRIVADVAGGLRLRGRKYYCTGALGTTWIAVTALNADDRVEVAFVETAADGVSIDDDWDAFGQRSTGSGTVTFDDVVVDPAFVIPYWELFTQPQVLGARAQLFHTAIQVGIARGSLEAAAAFVRTKSRPFFEAVRTGAAQSAAEDPHTLLRHGRLVTLVNAAEQLLAHAGATLDAIGLEPLTADEAARGSIAVAQAKAFASDVAVEVSSELLAQTGTSGADSRYGLDRYWRNARTHSVHDPVDWKYHHIGRYSISGSVPPNHAQI